MNIIKNEKERNRFLKFAVVGLIGFFVDAGIFNICRSVFFFQPEVASAISFSVAVISNFLFNRFWTYPDSRSKPIRTQLGQFFAVNLIGLGIRTGILLLIINPLYGFFGRYFNKSAVVIFLGDNTSLIIVVGIVLFWNFFVNRFWTYSDAE
jgi:putative flippase GtrA